MRKGGMTGEGNGDMGKNQRKKEYKSNNCGGGGSAYTAYLFYSWQYCAGVDSTTEQGGESTVTKEDYTRELEDRLAAVLSRVEGAGKVEVMITYESDGELVPAYQREENENRSSNGTQESYSLSSSNKIVTVYEQGTTTALILMKKKPQVKGVIVIAQGASDLTVRMSLSQAVRTVLQVSADRVDIFEMK